MTPCFYLNIVRGHIGVRLLWRGFILKDASRHPLTYTQRNIRRSLRFGHWYVYWLGRSA